MYIFFDKIMLTVHVMNPIISNNRLTGNNELFTLTEFEYARYAYTAFVKGNSNQINLKTVLFILTPYFLLKLLLQVYHIYQLNASF